MTEYWRSPYTYTYGTTSNGTSGLTFGYVNGVPMVGVDPSPPKKETPAVPAPVAGGAPTRTLFAKYTAVMGGFVGQVVYGDPERSNTNEGVIVWQSDKADRKHEAQSAAESALEAGFIAIFTNIPSTLPADDEPAV